MVTASRKKPTEDGEGVKRVARQKSPDKSAAAERSTRKVKLVRDSFTMPNFDFELIGALKERAVAFKRPTKKSELLRAGLQTLAALDDAALKAALARLVPLKPGRPKKSTS